MFLAPKIIPVCDVMSKKYATILEQETMERAVLMMLKERLDDIYVVDSRYKLKGVFTLSDVSRVMSQKINLKQSVVRFMQPEVLTIGELDTLVEARDLMLRHGIGRLPVVVNDEIIGVVRTSEIRDNFYMKMEEVGHQLNHIINNIHEAVCVVDDFGVVVVWNYNAERLYGVVAEEIIGKPLSEYFPNALLLRVLKERETIENVYHSPRAKSNIAISAQPIYIEGRFVGAVSTDRDITEVETLSNALASATEKVEFLEEEMKRIANDGFGKLIGKCPELQKSIGVARQVAPTTASVMINGESGTGKEVFARSIHTQSKRSGLFVPVNCSAIPTELFESEFFGYEAGAFTGANRKGKAGIFELADNGTVFLDEIADLPMSMQAKLLRVLQENEIRRVGGEVIKKVDVRVISATNKDLKKLVEEGAFREDLFFRLNVIEINLPPLRERGTDIDLFINKFLEDLSVLAGRKKPVIQVEALNLLRKYKWKGNVRELRNTIEQLVILCSDGVIGVELIPQYIRDALNEPVSSELKDSMDLNEVVEDIEKRTIKKALEMANGNKAAAAKLLNVKRTTLYYKIEQYHLND